MLYILKIVEGLGVPTAVEIVQSFSDEQLIPAIDKVETLNKSKHTLSTATYELVRRIPLDLD